MCTIQETELQNIAYILHIVHTSTVNLLSNVECITSIYEKEQKGKYHNLSIIMSWLSNRDVFCPEKSVANVHVCYVL